MMYKNAKSVMFMMLLSLFFGFQAYALEVSKLSSEVEKRIGTIMGLLQDKAMPKEVRDEKMIAVVEDMFDFELMARLSLGKEEWSALDDPKRTAFSEVFVKRLKRSYLEKLYLYTDETVEVMPAEESSATRQQVRAYVIDHNGRTELIYKFYKSRDAGWLIYDLEVEGVSFMKTYRTQFAGILKSDSIDGLIKRLDSAEPL